MRARRLLVLGWVAIGCGVAAFAETPNAEKIGAKLQRLDQRTREISNQLDAGNLSDTELQSLLEELLGYQDELGNDSAALKAALEEPSRQLDDLGPAPGDDQPPESANIAGLRASLSREVTRLQGLSKEVDLLEPAIDRLIGRARGLQSARFRRNITTRGSSPFSAKLWAAAAAEIPTALDALVRYSEHWWRARRVSGRLLADLALLLVALAGAIMLLAAPRGSRWRRLEAMVDDNPSPAALDQRRRVAGRVISRGLLVLGAGGLLLGAAFEVDLLGTAGSDFALWLWLGGAMLVLAWNFAQGVFSPERPEWRVAACDPGQAGRLRTLVFAIFGLFVAERVFAAGFALTGAGVESRLALAAVANVLFAGLLWQLSSPKPWSFNGATSDPAASSEPPSDPAAGQPSEDAADAVEATSALPHENLLAGGRVLTVLILVASALAYVWLANFVFHRAVLLAAFLILVWSVDTVVVWGLGRLSFLRPVGADTSADGVDTSQEELGFWLLLFVKLTLLLLSLPALLLVVGFDWIDLRRWFGFLSDDIQIGAVSFSFTNILSALAVFLLVGLGTRGITASVNRKLSQRTPLDAGARDSIMTLINYTGVVVGIVLALGVLGVGLTQVAVVAGALSVGIGFGLQNIVSNFVSGLILLFERPIKKGDWVVSASGEGLVKRIGTRATEIETFDRATIVIPNSDLVGSPVQNWFLHGRRGRVRVAVGVSYGSDPNTVTRLLLECAKQHPGVAPIPSATVVWKDFGESSLDFELRAFVRDYSESYQIQSELRFGIFQAFKDAGIEIPFPQRDVHLGSGPAPAGDDTTNTDINKDIEEATV